MSLDVLKSELSRNFSEGSHFNIIRKREIGLSGPISNTSYSLVLMYTHLIEPPYYLLHDRWANLCPDLRGEKTREERDVVIDISGSRKKRRRGKWGHVIRKRKKASLLGDPKKKERERSEQVFSLVFPPGVQTAVGNGQRGFFPLG